MVSETKNQYDFYIATGRQDMNILQNIRRNRLSLISLLVALVALGYNTWRNEHSEANRTVRAAGFEIIRHLGELERVVFLLHYDTDSQPPSPREGWVVVQVLSDLSQLMPAPVPEAGQRLFEAWGNQWAALETSEAAVQAVQAAIQTLREETLKSIQRLD